MVVLYWEVEARGLTVPSHFVQKCDKCYYKVRQVLLQSATSVITKCDKCYYKVRQVLLQSATSVITKCDKCYYKVRQVLLQSATSVITKYTNRYPSPQFSLRAAICPRYPGERRMMVTRGWGGVLEFARTSESMPAVTCPSVRVRSSENMRQFCASSGFIAFAQKGHLFTGYFLGRSVSRFAFGVGAPKFAYASRSSAQRCRLSMS